MSAVFVTVVVEVVADTIVVGGYSENDVAVVWPDDLLDLFVAVVEAETCASAAAAAAAVGGYDFVDSEFDRFAADLYTIAHLEQRH